jgi:hypothetical protein
MLVVNETNTKQQLVGMTDAVIQSDNGTRTVCFLYTVTLMIQNHTQAVTAKAFLISHTWYSELVVYLTALSVSIILHN